MENLTPDIKHNLYYYYLAQVVPNLRPKYKNIHQVPKITKIVINQSAGSNSNSKDLNILLDELAKITGQYGKLTQAKKSIAGFGITKSDFLGIKLTLRRQRMYYFLNRLINLSLPRIRDFQGLTVTSFDGYGNYSFGVEEQLMFPEINPESFGSSKGLQISIVTTAKTDEEAYLLLKSLGMPFKQNTKFVVE